MLEEKGHQRVPSTEGFVDEKQCDVELSNVLQAFQVRAFFCSHQLRYISPLQAELLLDVRVSLLVVNPEVRGSDIKLNTLRLQL